MPKTTEIRIINLYGTKVIVFILGLLTYINFDDDDDTYYIPI